MFEYAIYYYKRCIHESIYTFDDVKKRLDLYIMESIQAGFSG